RTLPRRHEEDFVVYRPRKEGGFVSRFPDLQGFDRITPGPAVELMPYVTSKSEYLLHEPGDPFHGADLLWNGGGDLRIGIASRMTRNATINADCGRVEVDPEVVNLPDVETFLDERRPFFVEGASTFDFGRQGAGDYWDYQWEDPLFFYSRRIGREPQGKTPSADYQDVPAGARILGAVKLTGHLTPAWNFGMLNAVTDRKMARLAESRAGRGDGRARGQRRQDLGGGGRASHVLRRGAGPASVRQPALGNRADRHGGGALLRRSAAPRAAQPRIAPGRGGRLGLPRRA